MEIGNNPRLLFNHLGQAIVENNKYSNVCEMRLMDRITLSVDKSFETRVGFPYTMAGKSKEYIRIQPGSTIDNEPATDDTIYFQNRKKDYAVLEKQHRGSLSYELLQSVRGKWKSVRAFTTSAEPRAKSRGKS